VFHSYELIVGVAAVAVTLAMRAFTVNRLIRSKLRLSLLAFGAYVALAAGIMAYTAAYGAAPDRALAARLETLQSIGELLLALGAITLLVVTAINPWRADRTPEHFPNIVQDAIIIGVFLIVATGVMEEKFLTTSAVGAVVIGFALQDTLGNTFAGLVIQVEKPFRVGHWIKVGPHEGRVVAITWRATRLQTKNGDAVVLPNNIVSKEAIANYSEPAAPTRLAIEVGASYDRPPNEVKAIIAQALADASLVLKTPAPEVVVADFAASAITYRIKFWIGDYGVDDPARDQVRTCIYYAFRRHGVEIPYPTQVQVRRTEGASAITSQDERIEYLGAVDLFAPLSREERAELATLSRERLYGAGQTVVREGQAGDSMFIVGRGSVRVAVGETATEVATIPAGGYFGEMSLLTGEPRTATVSAITDCLLLEIGAEDFRRIALAHPPVVQEVTSVVAERRSGLARSREGVTRTSVAEEAPRSFLLRVRQFLRI
jgi:small-conductance mechanosensitive channel